MLYLEHKDGEVIRVNLQRFVVDADIRTLYPDTSLPSYLSDEFLKKHGFEPIHDTDMPDADVVTEGTPVLEDDGKWYQTWNSRPFNEEEKNVHFLEKKERTYQYIESMRRELLSEGIPYNFNGVEDRIQTREGTDDKTNLLGLRIEAENLKKAGVSDAMIPFRAEKNTQYYLTPEEVIEMTSKALAAIQEIYKRSWELKDILSNVTKMEDLENIRW